MMYYLLAIALIRWHFILKLISIDYVCWIKKTATTIFTMEVTEWII